MPPSLAENQVKGLFAGRSVFLKWLGVFGYNSLPDRNPVVRRAGVIIIKLWTCRIEENSLQQEYKNVQMGQTKTR